MVATISCIPYSAKYLRVKFSQIAIFDEFVEIISQIPCMRTPQTGYTMGVVYKPNCSNMHHHIVSAWAHNCQQSNAYFEGISLERKLSLRGCCPLLLLQSQCEKCVACLKISKIKDLQKSCTIWYVKKPVKSLSNLVKSSETIICKMRCEKFSLWSASHTVGHTACTHDWPVLG